MKIQIHIFLLLIICSCLLSGCGEEYDYSYKGLPSTENTENDSSANETFSGDSSTSIIAYSSVKKAQEAIGFPFASPSALPSGYALDEISIVKDQDISFAQVNYKKNSNDITYRVSITTDTLNSDRSTYEKEKMITISNTDITCLCNKDTIFVATWQKDGTYYCIMSTEGLDTTTMSAIIVSIK